MPPGISGCGYSTWQKLLDDADRALIEALDGRAFADQRAMLRAFFALPAPELTSTEIDAEVDAALAEGAELRRQMMD